MPVEEEKTVLTNLPIVFAKGPNIFNSLSENKEKKFVQFFSQMIPLDTYKAVPTELPQIIRYNFEKLPPKIRKIKHWKNCSYLVLKFFLSKIECSFDKHADVFLPTAEKLSTKNPKTKNKLLAFLKPFVFLEWFVSPRTMQFRQICPKFSGRTWKKIRWSSTKTW